jgi:hypothetical protein
MLLFQCRASSIMNERCLSTLQFYETDIDWVFQEDIHDNDNNGNKR